MRPFDDSISYIPKKTMKLMNNRFVCLATTPSETLYELFCVEGAKPENNEKAVSKLFYFILRQLFATIFIQKIHKLAKELSFSHKF